MWSLILFSLCILWGVLALPVSKPMMMLNQRKADSIARGTTARNGAVDLFTAEHFHSERDIQYHDASGSFFEDRYI